MEAMLLLGPRICQPLGKAGYGEFGTSGAVDNFRDDSRRNEREWEQQPNMPLDLALSLGNFSKRGDPAFDEVVNPDSSFSNRAEQCLARGQTHAPPWGVKDALQLRDWGSRPRTGDDVW